MKKIIEEFTPCGGKHCITNALKQVFEFNGFPLSEEMILGIGEGLDFTYINLVNAPMISGRSKVMEFESVLAERLELKIQCKSSKNNDKIFDTTKKLIDNNQPVLIYADMPFLDYLGMDSNSHFGGHAVVLFGYDDERNCFYVSDRDNSDYPIRTPKGMISENYHLVNYSQVQTARSSHYRPFPANNKYVKFDFTNFQGVKSETLITSILNVCGKMLNPPANLKGVNGILKFSKEIKKWKSFDANKLRRAGAANYFQINADGGTGGGIFRNMYGGFLMEVSALLKNDTIKQVGFQFIELAAYWDTVASLMWNLYETGQQRLLNVMSENIQNIYETECNLLNKLMHECK